MDHRTLLYQYFHLLLHEIFTKSRFEIPIFLTVNKRLGISADKEIEVLKTIHSAEEKDNRIVQRDIAYIVGVSIGMTNTIIKRLAKKGLLSIHKINSRNIRYTLSPAGIRALSEKSYRYFKRTIKNVVYYKEKIGDAISAAAEKGAQTVVLLGESDLGFIIEHFCFKYGLGFRRVKDGGEATAGGSVSTGPGSAPPALTAGEYPVYSEKIAPPDGSGSEGSEAFYLRTIVV
jgi:DNA-binding MarR family transcriptional regulator